MRRWIPLLLLAASASYLHAAPPPPEDDVPPPTVSDDGRATPEPEPEVRVIQKGDVTHEEYRVNGHLYMVKVTPKVGPPYYLVDEDGSGQMKEADPTNRIVMPRWVLLRF